MSNPFETPDDKTNPFFMTESEQSVTSHSLFLLLFICFNTLSIFSPLIQHNSLIDFGDEQPILIPSSSPVSYPPLTVPPTATQSVNLIDIGDAPKVSPPQQQNAGKNGGDNDDEEEIVFTFEPIPAEVKDITTSDENNNLLGDVDGNDDSYAQQQQQQQQQPKKKNIKKKKPQEENGDEGGAEEERKWYHMFYKISYYRQYFNVDTVDVGDRIVRSLVPIKNFFEVIGENPDLYGPFWITTTLLFALTISSNFSSYIAYWMDGRENDWGYEFVPVTVGAAVLYSYLVLAGLAVWLTQKYWLKHNLSLVSCLCIYGYSLTPFVIGTVKK